jgi:dihydroflavonol-4-reductase
MSAIVVTGGAGHVGSNLVESLVTDGHDVRVVDLRRPPSAVATWLRLDVRDEAGMRRAFEGASVVYHLAAVISVAGGMRGEVGSVNVAGVRSVVNAALATGVPRLVHCSSIHAFDLAACAGRPIDEESPLSRRRELPVYDRSKAAGEVEVQRAVDRGLDAVIVNPTGVIGPGDPDPSRMGVVLRALWRRRLPAVVAGGFDWVDVRDAVRALMTAADRGRVGATYLVPGHRHSMADMVHMAERVAGRRLALGTAVAQPAVRVWAPLATAVARRWPHPLLPTREALAVLRTFPVVNGARAARELGHLPRPIEQTLGDLYEYFFPRPPSIGAD